MKKNNVNIKDFNKKGYLIFRDFFTKSSIIKAKVNILSKIKKSQKGFLFYELNSSKLRRIENVVKYSKDAKEIITKKKIKLILKKMIGTNVLFKDKLNFKFPNSKGFKPHIDGHFTWIDKNNKLRRGWKEYSNSFINVVIPLENTNLENGCLEISEKEDTLKYLGKTWDDINRKTIKYSPKIKKKYLHKIKFIPIELNVGDLLLFDWKLCHRSKDNKSNSSRMIFYATYAKSNSKNLKEKYYTDKLNSKNSLTNKGLN